VNGEIAINSRFADISSTYAYHYKEYFISIFGNLNGQVFVLNTQEDMLANSYVKNRMKNESRYQYFSHVVQERGFKNGDVIVDRDVGYIWTILSKFTVNHQIRYFVHFSDRSGFSETKSISHADIVWIIGLHTFVDSFRSLKGASAVMSLKRSVKYE